MTVTQDVLNYYLALSLGISPAYATEGEEALQLRRPNGPPLTPEAGWSVEDSLVATLLVRPHETAGRPGVRVFPDLTVLQRASLPWIFQWTANMHPTIDGYTPFSVVQPVVLHTVAPEQSLAIWMRTIGNGEQSHGYAAQATPFGYRLVASVESVSSMMPTLSGPGLLVSAGPPTWKISVAEPVSLPVAAFEFDSVRIETPTTSEMSAAGVASSLRSVLESTPEWISSGYTLQQFGSHLILVPPRSQTAPGVSVVADTGTSALARATVDVNLARTEMPSEGHSELPAAIWLSPDVESGALLETFAQLIPPSDKGDALFGAISMLAWELGSFLAPASYACTSSGGKLRIASTSESSQSPPYTPQMRDLRSFVPSRKLVRWVFRVSAPVTEGSTFTVGLGGDTIATLTASANDTEMTVADGLASQVSSALVTSPSTYSTYKGKTADGAGFIVEWDAPYADELPAIVTTGTGVMTFGAHQGVELTCFPVAPRYLAVPAQPTGVPMAVQRNGNQTNFEWETFPAADDTTTVSWNNAVQELVTKANADVHDETNYIQASPARVNRIPKAESGDDEVISNAPLWWTLTSRELFAKIQNFEGPRVNIRIHRVVHQPGSSSWVWVTHRLRFVHESIPFDWTYSAAVDQTESALDSLRAQLISSFPTWKELESERGSLSFTLPGRDLYPNGYPNGVETAGGVTISYGKHFLGDDHSNEKSWAVELLNSTLSKSLQDLKLETSAQVTAERGPMWKLLLGTAFQFLEDGKFLPTETGLGSTVAIGPGLVVQPEATRCIVRLWAQPAGQTQWVLDHEFGVQDLRNAKMFRVKTAGLGRMYLEVLATDGWMVADLAPADA